MDPCHSVARGSSASSALTVAHLIRNIEQLKNKDKLISQLEKDLSHQWGAAQIAALDRGRSEGRPGSPLASPSPSLRALPDGSDDPDFVLWTPSSIPENGCVEDAWSMAGGNTQSKPDLFYKLKELKERNKELLLKCRGYLQKNKELTAQNRAFKDSNDRLTQDYKKTHELLEHSKLNALQLSRQLSQVKAEKTSLDQQFKSVESLRQEMMEDKKMITALRKACSEKDRRIELIQHRKKRRRMMVSEEKTMGVKETFYGYEEDSKSLDSENSFSSLSHSTLSDEDQFDDVLSREEIERNYQRLMLEHLKLEKSFTLLQKQTDNMHDPQRESMARTALQNDLFSAQCRIEYLEQLVNEIGEGEVVTLIKEREMIVTNNKDLLKKTQQLEVDNKALQKHLTESEDKNEDLEFRLIEMEQWQMLDDTSTCEDPALAPAVPEANDHNSSQGQTLEPDSAVLQPEIGQKMDQLRKEVRALAKGQGSGTDSVMGKVDTVEKNMLSMESMAQELQSKVIALQKEKDSLQDRLLLMEQSQPGKGGHSASLSAAKERQENLELKTSVEINEAVLAERDALSQNLLENSLDVSQDSNDSEHVAMEQAPLSRRSLFADSNAKTAEPSMTCSYHSDSSSTTPPLSPAASPSRKSKLRSKDDATTKTKRRRSSKDAPEVGSFKKSLKSYSSSGDIKYESTFEYVGALRSSKSSNDVQTMTTELEDWESMSSMKVLQTELTDLKRENASLSEQLSQMLMTPNGGTDSDKQSLVERVAYLERELELLQADNRTIGDHLRLRVEEFQFNRNELQPELFELEDYCEDLQERLRVAENSERMIREKYRQIQKNIEDTESSELAMRERCEQLLSWEFEAKKQIQELQRTGRELKDIVIDKEFVEQALRDKVDFLQKAEAFSVQRIDELEAIEKELRDQLEQKTDSKTIGQKEAKKIQELRHQLTFLETDNKALAARLAQLEENEEVLRDNWRKVADESYNHVHSLEEKLRILESKNRELKVKCEDAQECIIISSMETSLAAELAQSQSRTSSMDRDDSEESSDYQNEVESERTRILERKMSELNEEKNMKIETLQDRIIKQGETEIKLSETISEMEMIERELRAKLALYESSEVTVDKMLKYQSKILELRTSQESLLDQLENMENQEMTLQEKMQEMERTLRGKIVTLEVEMKGFKQKEIKDASKIREFEKQVKELTDKVTQQAEKENNLYIKISSLKDEVKEVGSELEKKTTELAEAEEKARQSKLLEVKLLEIEMEYGKKTATLNAKLRHKEEELRQKEVAFREEISVVQGEADQKHSDHGHRMTVLEESFASKEKEYVDSVSSLNDELKEVKRERDMLDSEVKKLMDQLREHKEATAKLQQDLDESKARIVEMKTVLTEKEEAVVSLHENVEGEKLKLSESEAKTLSLQNELESEKQRVLDAEQQVICLKDALEEKAKSLDNIVAEKGSSVEQERQCWLAEMQVKEDRVQELEQEIDEKSEHIKTLEEEKDDLKDRLAERESESSTAVLELKKNLQNKTDAFGIKVQELQEVIQVMEKSQEENQEKLSKMEALANEKEEEIHEMLDDQSKLIKSHDETVAAMRREQEMLENELRNKVMFLNSQLQQHQDEKEVELSTKEESAGRIVELNAKLSSLQQQVEKHKFELIEKLSELEAKNKTNCELSLELSSLQHSCKILRKELDNAKDLHQDTDNKLKSTLSERDQIVDQLNEQLVNSQNEVERLKEKLADRDQSLVDVSSQNDLKMSEKYEEMQQLKKSNCNLLSEISDSQVEMQNIQQSLDETEIERKDMSTKLKQVIEELELKEHTLKQKSQDYDELSQLLKDQDHDLELAESKVMEAESKLKQAENRYRELESTCVSLELRLEERFAEAQDTEKVLLSKDKEFKELENKLKILEEEHHELVSHCEEISGHSEVKGKLFEDMRSKISSLCLEIERLNDDVADSDSLDNSSQLESERRTDVESLVAVEDRLLLCKSTIESMRAQFSDMKHIDFEREEKLEKLNTEMKECIHSNQEMEQKLKDYEQEIVNSENVRSEQQLQIKLLEEAVSVKEQDVLEVNRILEKSEDDHSLKCNEFDNVKSECEVAFEKLSMYEQRMEKLESQMNSSKQDFEVSSQTTQEKLDHLQSLLEESEQKCESLALKLEESESKLLEKGRDFESGNVHLQEAVATLEGQLEEKELKVSELLEQNAALTANLDGTTSEKNKFLDMHQQLSQDLEQQEQAHQTKLETIQVSREEALSTMQSALEENEGLMKLNNELENELRNQKQSLSELGQSYEECSQNLLSCRNELEATGATIVDLEKRLSDAEENQEESLKKVTILEEEKWNLEIQNKQLQDEFDEVSREFENLQKSVEESKANVEKSRKSKETLEEDYEALKRENDMSTKELVKMSKKAKQLQESEIELTEKNCELESTLASLRADGDASNARLQQQIEEGGRQLSAASERINILEAEIEALKTDQQKLENENKRLEQMQSFSKSEKEPLPIEELISVSSQRQSFQPNPSCSIETEVDMEAVDIDDIIIQPDVVSSLQTAPPSSQNDSTNTEDSPKDISNLDREQVEALTDEVESYKEKIEFCQCEMQKLQASLTNSKQNEHKLKESVDELERARTELREQIVDIEHTVIVPLETENQDLKDELSVVKEERDSAYSKVGKWDEEDGEEEGGQHDMESINKSLEDALEKREELEKKISILLNDIAKLESEREEMIAKIADLEMFESETAEKMADMEEEIVRLSAMEKRFSVLEESETRLMDKVLDLEEREHILCKEVEHARSKTDETQAAHDYMVEKVDLLRDSEAKLMDKLMEAEEKIQGLSCKPVSHEKEEVLTKELDDAKRKTDETQVAHDYMLEKLNLLRDSESKLMAALLNAEERIEELSYRVDPGEAAKLKEKIEQLHDENEFLAQNVENYKKLYKDEKEKTNELQAEIMEESSLLNEVQETKQELVTVHRAFDLLQCDYENLLADREEDDLRMSQLEESTNEHASRLRAAETQKEEELLPQIESLHKEKVDLREKINSLEALLQLSSRAAGNDDSIPSDSGVSSECPRTRNDLADVTDIQTQPEAPIEDETFTSTSTLVLCHKPPPSETANEEAGALLNPPTLSRKPRPPDAVSRDELLVPVDDDLQRREASLVQRVRDLQGFQANSEVDHQDSSPLLLSSSGGRSPDQEKQKTRFSGDDNNNKHHDGGRDSSGVVEDLSFSSPALTSTSSSSSSSGIMLDKPEDVLMQRIKELEGLDKYHKQEISELEQDRELLHEIARKDKSAIHDLKVKIRELQLSERGLKEQVSKLEESEGSLYSKCDDLEATRLQLGDRVHELEIHERRLRELVRKLKLDEERWLSKTGGMEDAVAELSANEHQLKRMLQDAAMEKGGLSERAEYLQARIRELENVEVNLVQRIKTYENSEVSLQNRLVQLENSETAAHSKASELEALNLNLTHRIQKATEENMVMSQHLSRLHGQIQELDRQLMSSRDAELAFKQHVESLQKNESLLQKKVREFELREIDTQSKVRELEQLNEISQDRLAALQRSENILRYRVQELESIGGEIPGDLKASERQKLPRRLEDCQRRIVALQNQVETLQLQLKQALQATNPSSAQQTEDGKNISMPKNEFRQLHTKAALSDELGYQNEELENMNEKLNITILQLRQGKDASGHEVEIEVLKRRIDSYKTFITKLKSSLSEGQATSLSDPDIDAGLQGETLPARHLHGLESERVLQSVRGLHGGKADTPENGGAQSSGRNQVDEPMVQSETRVASLAANPPSSTGTGGNRQPANNTTTTTQPDDASSSEESHWRAIEARKPAKNTGEHVADDSRGGVFAATAAKGRSSSPELEEVTIGLHLQSESDFSGKQSKGDKRNDTDSSCSPVPPPRKGRVNRLSKIFTTDKDARQCGHESGSDSSSSCQATMSDSAAAFHAHIDAETANQKRFDNAKSLPRTASPVHQQQQHHQQAQVAHQQRALPSLSRFGEDSFYLPSPSQDGGVDSLEDDEAPPPLPSSRPPGVEGEAAEGSPQAGRLLSSSSSQDQMLARKISLDDSTSGMCIRDRIALIEKQLQSDKGSPGNNADDQIFYWKNKSSENLRQNEILEKDNKHLKEDINRLEKELEEKRRYINILESWLSNIENLLRNNNKQTDREMVEQLQMELTKLRTELNRSGYNSEDAVLDPAALKTELEHRDREILSRRHEIELLHEQLKHWQDECKNVEGMRRTALDSLRGLEREVVGLQDKEKNLKEAQSQLEDIHAKTEKTREVYEENLNLRDRVNQSEAELIRLRTLCDDFNNLSARYDEMEHYKDQAVDMVQPLQMKVERLARKCREKDALLRQLGADMRKGLYQPSSALDELTILERAMRMEEYSESSPQSPTPTHQLGDKHRARSMSMDDLEVSSEQSDTDSTHMTSQARHHQHSPIKRKRPTPYVNNRPRSAEPVGNDPRSYRGKYAHLQLTHGGRVPANQPVPAGSKGQFIAIADYDPGLFSQSGRMQMELPLREGDHVFVTGPLDRSGYYEAEANGRTGLVPANYLMPANQVAKNDHFNDFIGQPSPFVHIDHSPELIMALNQQPLNAKARMNGHIDRMGKDQSQGFPRLTPDPPHSLHVKGVLEDGGIVLAWSPPSLELKHNSRVIGYMVYVNNKEFEQLSNPRHCEVVLEGLNQSTKCHLAVQCLGSGGEVSPRAEVLFEGMVKVAANDSDVEDIDTDLSSVLNSVQYRKGKRKTVMALYEYNPKQMSPHDYTTMELSFNAGDILYVYGEPQPNGFFFGEIDGERGLVPACFVQDVAITKSQIQQAPSEP